jgi:diguanylate cyclase (GGDEF)-like protein
MTLPFSSSHRAAHIAARYRNAALALGLAVALLASTAIWLVVQERLQVRAAAHRNQQDVAQAVQSSMSGLLSQSVKSLAGIRTDLEAAPSASRARQLNILREAQRFDPLSAYLGIRSGGDVSLVDARGQVRDDVAAQSVPVLGGSDAGAAVRFGALLKMKDDPVWYVTIVLPAPHAMGDDAIVFALVPTERLLGAAASLKVLPGSFVTLFTRSGARLFRKMIAEDTLEPNGKPVPAWVLALVDARAIGSFASVSTVDGRPTIYGYSNASELPLVVTAGVPESVLRHEWLAKATAPLVVLAFGLLGIVVFGLRLRGALDEQRAYVASQEYLASHDQLTGLPNRYAFLQHVQGLICGPAGRHGLCVLLLDVNRFKDVNDTLGHEAGDAVLQTLGTRLDQLLKADEVFVARLGGDELALCASHVDAGDAVAIIAFCEHVRAALSAPLVSTGIEFSVTAGIGIATYPADAQTALELLRCADIAMYRAKQDLAPYCRYTEGLDNFTSGALAMKGDFAKAIRDGSLSLVYQPKLRVSDLALVGVEALSRWNHPIKGPISPGEFLPLAETTELIHPFTDLVLKNAVGQIASWLAAGHAVPVAVNISANNLLDPLFVEKLRALLARTGVPARLLELEVTESAVMRYPDVMHKRLQEIRALGIVMSIDDFGTGYASLAYLKHLPVDTLKIDKLFITNADTDAGDRRIVRCSIQLAHGFGMRVVAEGVETQAVAELLVEEGCDFAQGYHFSRPVSAAAIEAEWLARLAPAMPASS